MAYQGRKTFTAGEVLTASDLNSTVDQTVMVFADETARTAAIPTPTEGMVAYTKDTNTTAYWSGSQWVAIADDKVNVTNGVVTTALTNLTVVRNITLSTADPSGGTDGQIWLKYE